MQSALTDGLLLCNPAAASTPKFKQFTNTVIYIVQHSDEGAFGVNLCQRYSQTVIETSSDFSEIKAIKEEELINKNLLARGPISQIPPWVLQPNTHPIEIAFTNQVLSVGFSHDALPIPSQRNHAYMVFAGFRDN